MTVSVISSTPRFPNSFNALISVLSIHPAIFKYLMSSCSFNKDDKLPGSSLFTVIGPYIEIRLSECVEDE